jgi:hypothetical protein
MERAKELLSLRNQVDLEGRTDFFDLEGGTDNSWYVENTVVEQALSLLDAIRIHAFGRLPLHWAPCNLEKLITEMKQIQAKTGPGLGPLLNWPELEFLSE